MGQDLRNWNLEDETYWEREGKKIANRNLWISIPSLLCGFAVWLYWGIIPGKAFGAINIDSTKPLIGHQWPSSIRTHHRGVNVCQCDGSVRFVSRDVSHDLFAALLSRNDQQYDRF